ncbi:MAG: DNA-binding protein [Eubacteriales bacterium]
MAILGLDTSNYTTSVALIDGERVHSITKLLPVPKGTLGLRQSDALFHHIKALPDLVKGIPQVEITAIGVSTKPRGVEGSYMPCFLAGDSFAHSLAHLLEVPCHTTSHQQGHLAAALWSLGRLDLMEQPFLAWHLSGGTTELLHATLENNTLLITKIGGTTDISAGQLLDRTGGLLGFDFPSGAQISALAGEERGAIKPFSLKLQGSEFSLSGMQNKVEKFHQEGTSPKEISGFVLDTIAVALQKGTAHAIQKFGALPVLYCGGVASSNRLRKVLGEGLFPDPKYCTDNALGVAVLAKREEDSK